MDLVTGATGLVGGNLVRALIARGRPVRVLVRSASPLAALDGLAVERVVGDVTDPGALLRACERIDVVYHCAAVVSMWPRLADAMARVNVGGTENLLTAIRQRGVRRLVHCSTVDAIGVPVSATDPPSGEETPWNWDALGIATPYARTKRTAEARVVAATDLDAVIVNPAYMFGAFDTKPSSGRMILEVAAGRAVGYTGGGNNFVDVEDVVAAMITAAERGAPGQRYILGHENLSYREIFTRIAAIVGVRPPRLAIPYPLARLAGWLGDAAGTITGREPTINTDAVKLGWVPHYFDSAKAVASLGLPQTPIETAIERAVHWFRRSGMIA